MRILLTIINNLKKKGGEDYGMLSDEELVKLLLSTRNTKLFEVIYDRYASKVYNKCFSFVLNEEQAKDLTQDIFLKLYIKLPTFKGNSRFSTWLYTLTYNFCVNYVQRDKAYLIRQSSVNIEMSDKSNDEIDEITDHQVLELKARDLDKALQMIPVEDKAMLLLKYQDEISIQELQQVMGLGASAVKMRLKRAKQKVVEAYNSINDES